MFNRNSGLVKIWVSNVQKGLYERHEVPNLSNLRTVVYEILDEQAAI